MTEKNLRRGGRALVGARHAAFAAILTTALLAAHAPAAHAQQQHGWIRAEVTDADGAALRGATVQIPASPVGALTDAAGRAVLGPVPVGAREVRASSLGFRGATMTVQVPAGDTVTVRFRIDQAPVEIGGISVSVLRPDLRSELELPEQQVREANPHDIGAVLRTLPGLDAVRRGALGLDPVVRGLRDTQVGAYVDGMRTLPGGPGGMDSPLSHVDPSAVRSIQVVKGPYALAWGAGNLSAIRVETAPLPGPDARPVAAGFFLGHDTNLGAREGGLELFGSQGRLAYTASGAWREGSDYTSGAGVEIPSGFLSRELRGRVGYRPTPSSSLTLSGWYQDQADIDYPGRPLDAEWFHTTSGSLRWQHAPAAGRLRALDVTAYVYRVDHGMNNDGKPTALPNPDRMPAFPLDIRTVSGVDMVGGRVTADVLPGGGIALEVGVDGYRADHVAEREIHRRDTGARTAHHLIWGGARIATAGAFVRADRALGPVTASGTVRLDRVEAAADTASEFFLQRVSSDLESSETNLSGSLTLTLPLSRSWSVSAGAGSVLRTAEANERFSDRNPARKSQIGAEFVGDPQLRPERCTQADLWLEAAYPRFVASLNLFARRLDDHITVQSTELPRQSMMSAPTVFRYVNGTARYHGAEASVAVALPHALTLSSAAAYLHGHDLTLDEPMIGVPPLRGDIGLRWQPHAGGGFVEGSLRAVARQDRVSPTRGEQTTPGYTTADLQAGFSLPGGIFLRTGVNNLFDREYVNHLNARNPFTGIALPEPGRVLFIRLSYRM
jgi:iron complex outermembrane recepter protein